MTYYFDGLTLSVSRLIHIRVEMLPKVSDVVLKTGLGLKTIF